MTLVMHEVQALAVDNRNRRFELLTTADRM